jgi:hypothetical protein
MAAFSGSSSAIRAKAGFKVAKFQDFKVARVATLKL